MKPKQKQVVKLHITLLTSVAKARKYNMTTFLQTISSQSMIVLEGTKFY